MAGRVTNSAWHPSIGTSPDMTGRERSLGEQATVMFSPGMAFSSVEYFHSAILRSAFNYAIL
jgi:hypothetical protein